MRDELIRVAHAMAARVTEREVVVEILMICLLSGHHPLLIGPPGCAKSTLVKMLAGAFGVSPFILSGHASISINDVFGPVSLAAAKNDEYRRATEHFVPGAEFCVLDEITRFSASIQHSLFEIMNDGVFKSNGESLPTNTLMIMGTDNALCQKDPAFWDRWMVRVNLGYVSSPYLWETMMRTADTKKSPLTSSLSVSDILDLREIIKDLPINDSVFEALATIRAELLQLGIAFSDRRWINLLPMLKANAFLRGDVEVQPHHLPSVLSHTLWDKIDQIPALEKMLKTYEDPMGSMKKEIEEGITALDSMSGHEASRAGLALSRLITGYRDPIRNAFASATVATRKRALKKALTYLDEQELKVKLVVSSMTCI